MKVKYEAAKMDVVLFEVEDVIATSNELPPPAGDGEDLFE